MAPVKPRNYEFNAASISSLRTRLKMKQTKMAELLGVPANTLSRWETGATKPDAESLAAIYSIAMENNISVSFFEEKPKPRPAQPQRSRAVVAADFQNLGVSAGAVAAFNDFVRSEVKRRVPSAANPLFKAFSSPNQSTETDELQRRHWRIWEDQGDWDGDIAQQIKSDCGHDPKGTTVFLITRDGDFADLITELKHNGVKVYLIAHPNTSKRLLDTVGKRSVITLPPNLR
ncbi:MAG: NYN domain-containing protein [Chloroflexota bacterium]|nr:NYN domain-containing protein [Chloroflexota bacterium]MDE2958989.1 NYN domain-containing protein [Chloroflexota bacterium]